MILEILHKFIIYIYTKNKQMKIRRETKMLKVIKFSFTIMLVNQTIAFPDNDTKNLLHIFRVMQFYHKCTSQQVVKWTLGILISIPQGRLVSPD